MTVPGVRRLVFARFMGLSRAWRCAEFLGGERSVKRFGRLGHSRVFPRGPFGYAGERDEPEPVAM